MTSTLYLSKVEKSQLTGHFGACQQVVSWYDNENSYTSQMVRTIKYFAELN